MKASVLEIIILLLSFHVSFQIECFRCEKEYESCDVAQSSVCRGQKEIVDLVRRVVVVGVGTTVISNVLHTKKNFRSLSEP